VQRFLTYRVDNVGEDADFNTAVASAGNKKFEVDVNIDSMTCLQPALFTNIVAPIRAYAAL